MRFSLAAMSFGLAAALCAGAAAPAFAQAICARLESQLAALQRGDPQRDVRAIERAYEQAMAQYDAARDDARAMGCSGGFVFREPGPGCGRILAALDRAEANLDRLEAQRDRLAYEPQRNERDRRAIVAALADNQCGPQYERFAEREPAPRRGGFFGSLFGSGQPGWGDETFEEDLPIPQVETYRTLCVRTCDGFYFPISFSTVQSQLGRDEEQCQSMCPGTEVRLYSHRNPGGGPENMVSNDGRPYTDLTTAFAYRQTFNPSCSCHFASATAGNFTPLAPGAAANGIASLRQQTPVPFERPEPTEDPETLANRAGGYVPGPLPQRSATVAGLNGEKSIRLIGPAYYYAQ